MGEPADDRRVDSFNGLRATERVRLRLMDDEEVVEPPEKYRLLFWIEGGTPGWRYSEEHWFVERPGTEIVLLLFADAKKANFFAMWGFA